MRTWTLVLAGLVAASIGATAAVLPTNDTPGQAAKQSQATQQPKKPAAPDAEDARPEVERHRVEVFGGRDVQIGVSIRDLEGDQARAVTGAAVSGVREDSPAAKAGIKEGDVIVEFDGERVRSARHLSRLVGETAAGHTVKVAVQRDGKRMDLQITPEAGMAFFDGPQLRRMPYRQFEFNGPAFRFDGPELRDFMERHQGPGAGEDFDVLVTPPGRGRLGIGVQDLTPQLAEYFGAKDGVLVTSVEPDSPAARAGLKAGDVITAVGDTQVSSPSDVTRAVRAAGEGGGEVSLTYMRDKKSATAKAKIEAPQRPRNRGRGQPI